MKKKFITCNNFLLLCIVILSLFLNLYKISDLMIFIGDAARDYLVARDMVITGVIPLVGIPSSVVWLHQGPISIYIIGLAFILTNFNPVAPAVLYSLIGVLTTFLVYVLTKKLFNTQVAFLSSLFYATSPLVIINSRQPYHTSSIPFFTILFFLVLYKVLKGKKMFFLLFLLFGFLLQVELSNAVLLAVLIILFYYHKINFTKKNMLLSICGFLTGVVPFILYDFSNSFVYTLGFPAWILNRIRLFLGYSVGTHPNFYNINEVFLRIIQQLSGVIFPQSFVVFFIILIFVFLTLLLYVRKSGFKKNPNLYILTFWFFVPIFGFIVHASPGTAYFPVLFPVISIVIGYAFYICINKYPNMIVLFIILVFLNLFSLIKNEYYTTTQNAENLLPPFSYHLGSSWKVYDAVVQKIISDSKGKSFRVIPGGFFSTVKTGIDNYKFLFLYHGAKINNTSRLQYTIYPRDNSIRNKIFYEDSNVVVTKEYHD